MLKILYLMYMKILNKEQIAFVNKNTFRFFVLYKLYLMLCYHEMDILIIMG